MVKIDLAALVVGAGVLVAANAEGVVQQAGGHADLPVWSLITQLQVESACPLFSSPGALKPDEPSKLRENQISCSVPRGTFFFLCSILDGYSRFIIHWEIRETMTEAEVETILQRAREQFPGERPRIISDNGPQFIARDFKEFIRICGMTHVRTSPYYPQSNGKMERWYKTLKGECIRVKTPLSLEDARRLVAEFVTHYNTVRLHSAIGYVTPADKLAGRAEAIWAARQEKLATANARRRCQGREGRNCPVAVLWGTLRRPGRRIGQRGDATRAPTRGQDRRGRHDAAPRPPGIGPKAINPFTVFVPSY